MAAQDFPDNAVTVVQPEADLGRPKGPEPSGIDGWLLLVALQNVVALVFSVVDGFQIFGGLFSPGFVGVIAFIAAVLFALFMSGIAIALNVAALVSMFRRSAWFPAIFIITCVWRVCKNVIEIGLMNEVVPNHFINPTPLTASVIWAVIWIPYVLKSKRVRNTFRTPRAGTATHV